MNRNTRKMLERLSSDTYTVVPPIVAKMLLEVDEGQGYFLEMALSGGTKQERLDGLTRLLFTYGVGNIVQGRLN